MLPYASCKRTRLVNRIEFAFKLYRCDRLITKNLSLLPSDNFRIVLTSFYLEGPFSKRPFATLPSTNPADLFSYQPAGHSRTYWSAFDPSFPGDGNRHHARDPLPDSRPLCYSSQRSICTRQRKSYSGCLQRSHLVDLVFPLAGPRDCRSPLEAR